MVKTPQGRINLMGRNSRPKPARLASKLKQIRLSMNLSQQQMIEKLNYTESPFVASQISEIENDKREPPIMVILCYARTAGIPMECLIDDEQDLPEKLPCKPSQWIFKVSS